MMLHEKKVDCCLLLRFPIRWVSGHSLRRPRPSLFGVRRDKAALSQWVRDPPGKIAPAGSNRSSYGGNEIAEASDIRSRYRRSSECAGRNVSER